MKKKKRKEKKRKLIVEEEVVEEEEDIGLSRTRIGRKSKEDGRKESCSPEYKNDVLLSLI